MKRLSQIVVLTLLLLALVSPVASAVPAIPQPSSQFYVLDLADVLDADTEQTIVQTSAALEQKTKAQVVVVTVDSLNGAAPEEYALAILRGWGIGDKNLNNGLLVLVSPTERVSRIEVGYGLEGALPDAKTGQIQDTYMLPYFRNNDYNTGILNGYRALIQEVAREYQVSLEMAPPQAAPADSPASQSSLPAWAIVLIIIGLILLIYIDQRYFNGFILGLFLGMLSRDKGGGGSGGGGFGSGGGFGGSGGFGG
ncbi:MAG TPA: TPM domain-containing protein, partial [Bacillota bacterium]|nr:TPM domain-containing protein [Bacillota bacterium]